MFVGLLVVPLVAAQPLHARHINWGGTEVTCSFLANVGMPHHFPVVYAYNTTRRRDRQKVAIKARLLKNDGPGFYVVAQTGWYTAYAWDHLPAQAWTETGTGKRMLNNEQLQWIFTAFGVYRVEMAVYWYGTARISSRRSGWRTPHHVGTEPFTGGPTLDYCVFAP